MSNMWTVIIRNPNTGKAAYRTSASKTRTAGEVKRWAEAKFLGQRDGAHVLPPLPPGDVYAVEVK